VRSIGSVRAASTRSGCGLDHVVWGQRGQADSDLRRRAWDSVKRAWCRNQSCGQVGLGRGTRSLARSPSRGDV
jgi:hypothetical protein